jgi:translation initiation factor IF-3
MDFGKFKYEQQKKDKLLRKRQLIILVKEVRFHPNTDTHDFEFKVRHARQFLADGNKVKASVVFRGRQMAHKEFGMELLAKFRERLADLAVVEREPAMEGRAMIAIFAPDKKKVQTTAHGADKPKKPQSSDAARQKASADMTASADPTGETAAAGATESTHAPESTHASEAAK